MLPDFSRNIGVCKHQKAMLADVCCRWLKNMIADQISDFLYRAPVYSIKQKDVTNWRPGLGETTYAEQLLIATERLFFLLSKKT